MGLRSWGLELKIWGICKFYGRVSLQANRAKCDNPHFASCLPLQIVKKREFFVCFLI